MIFEDRESKLRRGKTLLGFNETQEKHKNTIIPGHPESPDRIQRIRQRLEVSKIAEKCEILTKFVEIDDGDLEITHHREMVREVSEIDGKSQEEIDRQCQKYDSVFMTEDSLKVAKDGVACVRELTNRIMMGEAPNGFALVRPPGHHADSETPCGFCIFNNVAQAAEEAFFSGAERILIVDLDIHHGHGTQRIFYEDKRVLYFSIHRHEHGLFWPHLPESDFDHIGQGPGCGYNANLTLNEIGCTDSDYLSILFQVLMPLATQFDPHFVIVSAGFDCLLGDPLGGMCVSPDGYSHLIHHLKSLAQGRILMVLEGGYNHQVSAVAVQKCVRVLLGHAPFPIRLDQPPKESTVASCVSLVTVLRHYWNCFDYFPSRTTMRLAEWPIVNTKCEFNYSESERPSDTAEIRQDQLLSIDFEICDENSPRETQIFFNENDELHFDLEEQNHPEKPARTRRILKTIRESVKSTKIREINCQRVASDEEIRLVHSKEMLDHLKTTESMNDDELIDEAENRFNSIYLTKDTLKVARNAVGTVLESIDSIYEKPPGHRNAFVIVRPPGHHASADKSSGFCIFNNVALAAKYAQKHHSAKKVLIFDWDVHHGNGTQEIFYEDPSVMYMSIHRHDKGNFYPLGEPKDYFDVGENGGEGTSVNIPFSGKSMGDLEYRMAFHRIIMPIAYQFNPDLVLISAGFDAASGDPLGGYQVSAETFAQMTYELSSLANGRILAILEGGYNLDAISECSLAVVEVLQNRQMIRRLQEEKEQFSTEQKKIEGMAIRTVREVAQVQQKYWNILKGFQVIPSDIDIFMAGDDQQSSSSSSGGSAPFSGGPAHAVVPLATCPHLSEVAALPQSGIDAATRCATCDIGAEVWTCLTCYQFNCGRFVNEHSLMHHLGTAHPMALSMADLSVWCYPCDSYVHNPILIPAKSAAHESKFGHQMPH